MTLLRSAIDWTIRRLDPAPDVTLRARASLDRCVAAIEASVWPGAVDYFSGLNADGFPIEFAFSSRDAAVRYTSEAAAPEIDAANRLGCAVRRLEADRAVVDREFLDAAAGLQAGVPLTWGAAVGGRHDTTSDRMKIYAEVPRLRAAAADDSWIASARMLQPPRLVMMGWESGTARFERYFRTAAVEPGEVARLLAAIGLEDRAGELLHAVELSWQGSAAAALRERWGLSVAGPSGGPAEAVSLFKEANLLFGGDARTRACLIDLTRSLEAGGLDGYARVSAPLADSRDHGAHGILAFTVARGRLLELRIGVSPAAIVRAEMGMRRRAA